MKLGRDPMWAIQAETAVEQHVAMALLHEDVDKAVEHLKAAREHNPTGSLPISDDTVLRVVGRHGGWKEFVRNVIRRKLARDPRISDAELSRQYQVDRRRVSDIRGEFRDELAWSEAIARKKAAKK